MAFVHLSAKRVLRASAPVIVAGSTTLEVVQFVTETQGLTLVYETLDRTLGTCAASVQGSDDGTTYYSLGAALDVTIGANGDTYTNLQGPVPRRLRVTLTPLAPYNFDGSVAVTLRSNVGVVGPVTDLV